MTNLWGAKWRSINRVDGYREHLLYTGDCLPALFRTQHEARAWIKDKYGYIRTRPDLRGEPHGWRVPTAVRVTVSMLTPTDPTGKPGQGDNAPPLDDGVTFKDGGGYIR